MTTEDHCEYVGPCDGSYCASTVCADGSGGTARKVAKVERRTQLDAQGRARWMVTWDENGPDGMRGQSWFGTASDLVATLKRNGFAVVAAEDCR